MKVIFTALPPGRYVFQVMAENNEGMQSKNLAELNIRIKSPYWRTGWFLCILLFMLALLIYLLHSLRVNRILAVEKIRNRVARDLHDDMGSTLSTINILSSMAKSKMQLDQVKTSEYLNKISDNSQRMMEAMDDIVWAIKPSNDSMQKIVARMREFSNNVLEAKDIELDFSVNESVLDVLLDMEKRRDIYLVFKEAVNNIAKYSGSSKAWVQLNVANKKLILSVKDNGKGFDIKNASEGNGLGNMHKRAEALQAKLQILSSPGSGTEVILQVPIQ